jgi:hypothetical protein
MTQDEIINLARQAATGMPGFTSYTKDPTGTVLEYYTRLINLATAKEREACAKVSHPPQRTWVGLTTEEILDMFDLNNVYGSKWIEFARTVEAKLKEKNT